MPRLIPTGGSTGQVLTKTTSGFDWASGGSSSLGPGVVLKRDRFSPPIVSDFPIILDHAGAVPTLSFDETEGLRYSIGGGNTSSSGFNLKAALRSVSGSWTVVAKIETIGLVSGETVMGLVVRESGTGKSVFFGPNSIGTTDTGTKKIVNFTNETLGTNTAARSGARNSSRGSWYKIDYNGSTISFYISMDGQSWFLEYSIAATSIFTSAPNQVGIGSASQGTSAYQTDAEMLVDYWDGGGILASTREILVGGSAGPKGDPGVGMKTGGTAGQVLVKNSGTDYDYDWRDMTHVPVVVITGDTLLNQTHDGAYVRSTSASALTVTVQPDSTYNFAVGTVIQVRQAAAGAVSIVAASGVTVTSSGTMVLRAQNSTVSLVKVAANTWDLMGDVGIA